MQIPQIIHNFFSNKEEKISRVVTFIDTEVDPENERIMDIGGINTDGDVFHSPSIHEFRSFISGTGFLCGHNIIHHDLYYLNRVMDSKINIPAIDTLYLSPLLFPKKPYHSLLKDDKLNTDEKNNPLNDSKKAHNLFFDEVNAFNALPLFLKQIFFMLLSKCEEFRAFFAYMDFSETVPDLQKLILTKFSGMICSHADMKSLIASYPKELAYALALIWADDTFSITPPWLQKTFPGIENVFRILRNTPCPEKCGYCKKAFDIHDALQKYFNYGSFRLYGDEPLQEKAVWAAVAGKSLLAVFPTGGGKSLTFQLPALMAGQAMKGLTVVISPLQSLMKDQVDNLISRGITSAVTVNGLLDPIERANSLERIENGTAHLLYISPEQLRSRTIQRLLEIRNVIRFVIDEAHCFSAWGQDFRIDYLYIGEYIRKLQERKNNVKIPVSCFTATAKQKVISDIRDYFKRTLDLDLEIFATNAARKNLHYSVLFCETNEQKYNTLRNLISQRDCPVIVYVSRTKRSRELAERLTRDGYPAKPFNGKMDPNEKVENQESFIQNRVRVIVATSAFGMGVDKKDVGLVVHYDISSSLEDYVQEAGRAGRDESIQADCYVLFNDNDLDQHFMLLNQTKLSLSEIQQVWKAIKDLTRNRKSISCSPLEIARQAGWNDLVQDPETRVKTAIQALETAGYVKRGDNMPHIYATGIVSKNTIEARTQMEQSEIFSAEDEINTAAMIFSKLIGKSWRSKADTDEAESRVDYLADSLGITKQTVIESVNKMRQIGILNDDQDMTAFIQASDTYNRSKQILERFARLELFLLDQLTDEYCDIHLKELNEKSQNQGIPFSNPKNYRTLLIFLTIKNYISKEESPWTDEVKIILNDSLEKLKANLENRTDICRFILDFLFERSSAAATDDKGEKHVKYSLVGLLKAYQEQPRLDIFQHKATLSDIAEALLYLSTIKAMKLEGGFLVLYNRIHIDRLEMNNRILYKKEDYRILDEYYQQKIRQIHIVGEFANLMVRDYDAALQYVDDYFQIDHKMFIDKYFDEGRRKEINRNITSKKYSELFSGLSEIQSKIIDDKDSRYIVAAAGPGSGKTRVLVHKLAALLLMEDVKYEQLLMLTFSRAAATEFKKRLIALIGPPANNVEIKTFHSYCFDLLGKTGNLEDADKVLDMATEMIRSGEVESGKIAKSVLVIDEAQDMSLKEYNLVQALISSNDGMHVIAVGDDDQNIFEFRGSDSKYLRMMADDPECTKYEMTENYRSRTEIVDFSNTFATTIRERMKSAPGIAVSEGKGRVVITRYRCRNFVNAVINNIISTHGTESACILTHTNDEAMQVLGLLEKKGIRAKLIQSLGKQFCLGNLTEIRYFLSVIDRHEEIAKISDDVWNEAKEKLHKEFADSSCLEICENLIEDFETVYPEKYRTDLDEFIRESQFEDFYRDDRNVIYVSTIHKAKGREFDTVYMLLQNINISTESEKRMLYVGMTRAKSSLYIHCNTGIFGSFNLPEITHITDPIIYKEPDELMVQMTYKDVFLSYFKQNQQLITTLRSGMCLTVRNNSLFAKKQNASVEAARFSRAFAEKLVKLKSKGYEPVSAEIQFMVYWKDQRDEEETLILLPVIKLKRVLSK